MSIYATWLSIDDDNHVIGKCAHYVKATEQEARASGQMAVSGDTYWVWDDQAPCTCGQQAPIIYQGSHTNPAAADPRGGHVSFCAIPNHCHPSVRGTDTDDGPSVDYARLWVTGDDDGGGVVILDRRQVTELRDTLTRWIDSRDMLDDTEASAVPEKEES